MVINGYLKYRHRNSDTRSNFELTVNGSLVEIPYKVSVSTKLSEGIYPK